MQEKYRYFNLGVQNLSKVNPSTCLKKNKTLPFYYNCLTINKSIEKNCQVFSNKEFLKVGKGVKSIHFQSETDKMEMSNADKY